MILNRLLMTSLVSVASLAVLPEIVHAEEAAAEKPAAGKVKPVEADKLKTALPEKLGDMKRGEVQATELTLNDVNQSSASAPYAVDSGKDDAPTANLNVLDLGDPEAIKGIAGWSETDLDVKINNNWQKTIKIEGQPAMQSYNGEARSGTLVVAVGQRVLITASFENVTSDEFKSLCDQVPVKAVLELLKK